RASIKLSIASSAKFVWHLLHLPLFFFAGRYPGDVAARVEINDRFAELLAGRLSTTLLSSLLVLCSGALMLYYDPLLASVTIAGAAINAAILQGAARRRIDQSRRLLQDSGNLQGLATSGLRQIESIKANGSESDFFAKWVAMHAKVVSEAQDLAQS